MPGSAEPDQSFESFYREMWPPVLAFLMYWVGASDAEDVAQKVFEKAYQRWPLSEMSPEHRERWLMTVARSSGKDHWRGRGRHAALLMRLGSQPAIPVDGLEDVVTARDIARQLAEAAGAHSEKDVELLMLLAMGYTTSEIASILDISATAVTSRINRLRKRLRKAGFDLDIWQEDDDV